MNKRLIVFIAVLVAAAGLLMVSQLYSSLQQSSSKEDCQKLLQEPATGTSGQSAEKARCLSQSQ